MAVKNHGFDFGNGVSIPIVASHVDLVFHDVGKQNSIFFVMQEVVSVHPRFIRGIAYNSFLGLADSVAHKYSRACSLQVGQKQLIVKESVILKNEMTHTHHSDSFVITPKHIVSDDQRVHRSLDAVRRIA